MKANELRINNYYESVKFKTPVKCTINDLYELSHMCQGGELDSNIIGEMFKPIPLTEKWLDKCNVKLKTVLGESQPRRLLGTSSILFQIPEWIKSVHELQSWYYWNNDKKELDFK